MHLPTPLKSLVKWINFLPLWRVGRVRVWGQRLRAPNFDRKLCLWLHRSGLMGATERRFFSTHLRPGMTVVDVGANQGIYSLFFADQVGPHGQVLAFEPDDILHAALVENVIFNCKSNIQIHHLALGAAPGTMTLHRSLFNSGDNRLASKGLTDGGFEKTTVRVERLDRVLAGQHIDLIKMDVQGWEMEVLRGMDAILDDPQQANLAIYFEYWPHGLQASGSNPLEPLDFLSNRGFDLFRVVDNKTVAINDLPAFVHSVRSNSYINLYAVRRSSPPIKYGISLVTVTHRCVLFGLREITPV